MNFENLGFSFETSGFEVNPTFLSGSEAQGKYTIRGASGYVILILLHICCLISRVNSMFTCKFLDGLSKPIPVGSMKTGIR